MAAASEALDRTTRGHLEWPRHIFWASTTAPWFSNPSCAGNFDPPFRNGHASIHKALHTSTFNKKEQTCLANVSIFTFLFLAVFLAFHVFPLTSVSLENSFPWHFFLLRTLSLHISFSWYDLFIRLSSTLFLLWRWLYLFYVNVLFLSSLLVFSILVHFLLDFLSSRCCMCTCQKHPSFEKLGTG